MIRNKSQCSSWTGTETKLNRFKQVADHFKIKDIIYDGVPRLVDEDVHGTLAEWDEQNSIAIYEKLQFYVKTRVDDTVTNGDELTARTCEYYVRLQGLFLRTGSESVASLHWPIVLIQRERRFLHGLHGWMGTLHNLKRPMLR